MFKLKEYTKSPYVWRIFSITLSSSSDDEDGPDTHNLLGLGILNHSWYWQIPRLIRSQQQWVDLSNESWATERDGKKGYMDYIKKQYGVTLLKDNMQINYGIQPGQWISNDPKNSDHTKVLNYFWRFQQVRHDALYLDGQYLCPDRHRSKWQRKNLGWSNRKGLVEGEERTKLFFQMNWFTLPNSDHYANTYNEQTMGEYDNWSDIQVDPQGIYKFCEYKDKYDNTMTLARLNVEEREWVRGKWSWLRSVLQYIPGCKKTIRYLEIEFKDEVGSRKHSWHGGVLGCGEEFLPNETTESCWKRFCKERTFK